MSFSYALRILCCFVALSALTGCDSPEQSAAKHMKRGNAYLEQSNYTSARLEYKNAAKLQPASAEASYRLGTVDEAEGNIKDAFENFMRAEQQDPHYHPALLKIAHYMLIAGEKAPAEKRISSVLAEDANDAEAHALFSALTLENKDYELAEKEARAALALDKKNVTAVFTLATLYNTQKNPDKSYAVIDESLKENQSELSLWLLKAALYEENGNMDNVTATFETIFKLRPKETRFYKNLIGMYLKHGKVDDAEKTLRRALAAFPEDKDMKRLMVEFDDKYRSLAVAEKEIRDFQEANPKDATPSFWLADLYMVHAEPARAKTLLQEIVTKNIDAKTSATAETGLARLALSEGNRSEAQKLIESALAKDANNNDALVMKAKTELDVGHYQKAVGDLRTVLRNDPKNKKALQYLAEVLPLQHRIDLAIDTLKELIEVDPTNTMAKIRLAQMMGMHKDFDKAFAVLDIVVKTAPNDPLLWESMSRLSIDAKNFSRAELAIARLKTLPNQEALADLLEAQVYLAQNRPQQALPLLTKVIQTIPDSALAQHAILDYVEVQASQKKLTEAAAFLAALPSSSPFVASTLGECYLKIGKKQEAAIAFEKALAQKPDFQNPYLGRAALYANARDYDKAITLLRKAAEVAPSDVRASMLIASLYEEMGKYKDSIETYAAILEDHPDIDVAANNYAEAVADHMSNDRDMLEKARQVAERFIGGNDLLALDTLAWVYIKQVNLPQAQTLMDRLMATGKVFPAQVYYHYGVMLNGQGKKTEAREALTKATAKGERYPGSDDAKKILENLMSGEK